MRNRRGVLAGVFVLLPAVFVSLGAWQLRRADERAAVHERFAAADTLAPLNTAIADSPAENHRYRRVELRGQYLPGKQLLLDSMTYLGRAGYHVLTPLRPTDGSAWVLVNRGWVEANPDRRILPQIDVSDTRRVVRGRIDTLPRPGLVLGGSSESSDWPAVVLFPTFDELEARYGAALARYQLLLDPDLGDGFVREWRPRVPAPERHRGYAIQWFAFAGVVAMMGIFLGIRAHRGS